MKCGGNEKCLKLKVERKNICKKYKQGKYVFLRKLEGMNRCYRGVRIFC